MQHSNTSHIRSQDSITSHHTHSSVLQPSQMDFVSSMILQLLESVDKELKDAFITIKHSLENADSATLAQTLSHISSQDKTLSIIKAFTLYHMLLNIIEELNLSDSATLNALPQTLLDLKNEGYDKQDILKVLQNIAFYHSDFKDMSEQKKCEILNLALSAKKLDLNTILEELSDSTRRFVGAFLRIAWAKKHISESILQSFIISMSSEPSDLLCVLWFAKQSGLWKPGKKKESKKGRAKISIAPLFETIDDLQHAKHTIKTLYANI